MKLRKLTTISYTIGEIRNFINLHMKNNCSCHFESEKDHFIYLQEPIQLLCL